MSETDLISDIPVEYKIRKLTRRDRKTLSDLIKKMVKTTGDKTLLSIFNGSKSVEEAISEEDKNASIINLGIELLNRLLEVLDNDMADWFSDLIRVTPEEFENCPFGIEADIVNQIISSKEISDFFSSVLQVSKTIKNIGKQ